MNDFTKEDLSLLLQWRNDIKYTKKPTPQMIASNERLSEKIKSLIDNYCEHDPVGDWHVCVDKCSKCGVICNE